MPLKTSLRLDPGLKISGMTTFSNYDTASFVGMTTKKNFRDSLNQILQKSIFNPKTAFFPSIFNLFTEFLRVLKEILRPLR